MVDNSRGPVRRLNRAPRSREPKFRNANVPIEIGKMEQKNFRNTENSVTNTDSSAMGSVKHVLECAVPFQLRIEHAPVRPLLWLNAIWSDTIQKANVL
jgi:hypothetical protein